LVNLSALPPISHGSLIVGSGYVGLVTGACFADVGHNVTCVDNDASKVEALQQGKVPIMSRVSWRNIFIAMSRQKRLRFSGSIKKGVDNAQVIFIAVPTPQQPDGSVDLSFYRKGAREIAAVLTNYRVIVDKSTVPVKTGEKVPNRSSVITTGRGVRCREQSGVSARRLRGRGPDEDGPDRDRRAKRARDRPDEKVYEPFMARSSSQTSTARS